MYTQGAPTAGTVSGGGAGVWESPVAPSHKRVFSRCRWPREVSAGTTLTSPERCQRLYPPHSHLCGCGQGLESSLGASQERDENSHLRSVGRTPWLCWATWVCLDGGHTVTVSLLSSCKKRALDSPLTLTEPPGMLASQLPTSAIPGAREKGSLLVWIPPALSPGGDRLGGRQVSPGQPGGVSLAPRVPRTPRPCPAGPCSFAAAHVSRPPSLPLPLPLPRRLTRTLCLFSCLHLGPADIVITPMHAGSARLPRAPAHSLTHNVPSRQASDFW